MALKLPQFVFVKEKFCPHCSVNKECYSEAVSLLKPSKCPWHEMDKEDFIKCLIEKPLLLIGDSRLKTINNAIYTIINGSFGELNFVEEYRESDHATRLSYKDTFDTKTGKHVVTRLWPAGTNVNKSIPNMHEKLNIFQDKPSVVLFNMGAHYLRVCYIQCVLCS